MSSMSSETQVMNILEKYFKTKGFIAHQISSYNHMIQHSLQEIVGEESVIDVEVKPNVKYRVEFGQVHIGQPQVIEEDRTVRNLYPAESRLRNDTYNAAIALDIVTFLTIDGVMKETKTIIYWKDCDGKYLGCNNEFLKVANLKSLYEIIGK